MKMEREREWLRWNEKNCQRNWEGKAGMDNDINERKIVGGFWIIFLCKKM